MAKPEARADMSLEEAPEYNRKIYGSFVSFMKRFAIVSALILALMAIFLVN